MSGTTNVDSRGCLSYTRSKARATGRIPWFKERNTTLSISIFLSYPQPFLQRQQDFIERLSNYLDQRGLEPKTLGVNNYDMEAPLKGIRRLMIESNGLLTVAFRRYLVDSGSSKPETDMPGSQSTSISGRWFTSPFCQIEPAMAFQLGLPVLVLRESGVHADGVLERGVLGTYMPEFDLDSPIDDYFQGQEFRQLIGQWEGYVRGVYASRGNPPQLY